MNDPSLLASRLRIHWVLRVMLQTRWSAEAWSQVRVEFRRAPALRSEIRRAGWFNGRFGEATQPFASTTTCSRSELG